MAKATSNDYIFAERTVVCKWPVRKSTDKSGDKKKDKEKYEGQMDYLVDSVCGLANSGGGLLRVSRQDYQPRREDENRRYDEYIQQFEQKLSQAIIPPIDSTHYNIEGNSQSKEVVVSVRGSTKVHIPQHRLHLKVPRDKSLFYPSHDELVGILCKEPLDKSNATVPNPPFKLLKNGTPTESRYLQFKAGPSAEKSKEKARKGGPAAEKFEEDYILTTFRKHTRDFISSFASFWGGSLVFGVAESPKANTTLPGVYLGKTDYDQLEMQKKIRTAVTEEMKSLWMWTDKLPSDVKEGHVEYNFKDKDDFTINFERAPKSETNFLVAICVRSFRTEFRGVYRQRPSPIKCEFNRTPEGEYTVSIAEMPLEVWYKRVLFRANEKEVFSRVPAMNNRITDSQEIGQTCFAVEDVSTLIQQRFSVAENGYEVSWHATASKPLQDFLDKLNFKLKDTGEQGRAIVCRSWAEAVGFSDCSAEIQSSRFKDLLTTIAADILFVSASRRRITLVTVYQPSTQSLPLLKRYNFLTALAVKTTMWRHDNKVCVDALKCITPFSELDSKAAVIKVSSLLTIEESKWGTAVNFHLMMKALVPAVAAFSSPLSHKIAIEFYQTLTINQYDVLTRNFVYPVVWVYGPAGSGKTIVALERMRQLAKDGVPANTIAYICAHEALRQFVSRHGKIGECSVMSGKDFLALRNNDKITKLFRHIVIDEAQHFDYSDPQHNCVTMALDMVSPNESGGSVWIFFDDDQNLCNLRSSASTLAQKFKYAQRNKLVCLKKVYRNTGKIFKLTRACLEESTDRVRLQVRNDVAIGHRDQGPDIRKVLTITSQPSPEEIVREAVTVRNELIAREEFVERDIAILVPRRVVEYYYHSKKGDGTVTAVKAQTMNSESSKTILDSVDDFTGLESPAVIFYPERPLLGFVMCGVSRAMRLLVVLIPASIQAAIPLFQLGKFTGMSEYVPVSFRLTERDVVMLSEDSALQSKEVVICRSLGYNHRSDGNLRKGELLLHGLRHWRRIHGRDGNDPPVRELCLLLSREGRDIEHALENFTTGRVVDRGSKRRKGTDIYSRLQATNQVDTDDTDCSLHRWQLPNTMHRKGLSTTEATATQQSNTGFSSPQHRLEVPGLFGGSDKQATEIIAVTVSGSCSGENNFQQNAVQRIKKNSHTEAYAYVVFDKHTAKGRATVRHEAELGENDTRLLSPKEDESFGIQSSHVTPDTRSKYTAAAPSGFLPLAGSADEIEIFGDTEMVLDSNVVVYFGVLGLMQLCQKFQLKFFVARDLDSDSVRVSGCYKSANALQEYIANDLRHDSKSREFALVFGVQSNQVTFEIFGDTEMVFDNNVVLYFGVMQLSRLCRKLQLKFFVDRDHDSDSVRISGCYKSANALRQHITNDLGRNSGTREFAAVFGIQSNQATLDTGSTYIAAAPFALSPLARSADEVEIFGDAETRVDSNVVRYFGVLQLSQLCRKFQLKFFVDRDFDSVRVSGCYKSVMAFHQHIANVLRRTSRGREFAMVFGAQRAVANL